MKTGSKIRGNVLLLVLLFFILWVGLPRHQAANAWQSQVFERPSYVYWLKNAIDPPGKKLPDKARDKPGSMGEQPDDDEGNHFYPDIPEVLYFQQHDLFSFSATAYPAIHRDIYLPPPKV